MIHSNTQAFCHRMLRRPNAWAAVRGGEDFPNLFGSVRFYQTGAGVLVLAEAWGLPTPQGDQFGIFGFHIHSGNSCESENGKEFSRAGSHLNPEKLPHPEHAGDLPPLFAQKGYAWSSFLTARFSIPAILGKTVIIHDHPDDFTSQPSGNSGKMIACGVIR